MKSVITYANSFIKKKNTVWRTHWHASHNTTRMITPRPNQNVLPGPCASLCRACLDIPTWRTSQPSPAPERRDTAGKKGNWYELVFTHTHTCSQCNKREQDSWSSHCCLDLTCPRPAAWWSETCGKGQTEERKGKMPRDLVLGGSFTTWDIVEWGLKTRVQSYCAGCISGVDNYLFSPMVRVKHMKYTVLRGQTDSARIGKSSYLLHTCCHDEAW